jgi:hypothetical protein
MDTQHENIRSKLRVVGPVVTLGGILLIMAGCAQHSADEKRLIVQQKEWLHGERDFGDLDRGPGWGFFIIGAGMFVTMAGLAIVAAAFQSSVVRYQAREFTPIVKEALQEVAPGLARALGSTPTTAGLRCATCNAENPATAKYCNACGSQLRQPLTCNACGRRNDPDAKFCNGCGGPLG